MAQALTSETPVLLYDGECGLCAGSVQFVLRHEAPHQRALLRFAPLQGQFGAGIRSANRIPADDDTVVWVEPGRNGASPTVLLRSAAALAVLSHLGGGWRVLAALGRLLPSFLLDRLYDAIAKRRFSIVAPACLLPTAEQQQRFLA